MSQPLVSVVLCCHNRREYLPATLETVFAQNYPNIELIVMDDGSTDGTDELMASYADRLSYHRQECQGIAVARTNASRIATGEYIAYQDDDDLMPPDRIVSLMAALKTFPEAIFATGDFALIDKDGNLTGHRWLPGALEETEAPVLLADGQEAVLWPRVPAVPHCTLFRREYGEQIGWFDHEFKYACSDADFLARLGELGPATYVREVVSFYRRGHSALWSDDVRTSCSRVQLWEKHIARVRERHPVLHRQLQQRMLGVLLKLERYRLDAGGEPHQSGFDLGDYINRGLVTLDKWQRLNFELRARIKLPLKKLLQQAAA